MNLGISGFEIRKGIECVVNVPLEIFPLPQVKELLLGKNIIEVEVNAFILYHIGKGEHA